MSVMKHHTLSKEDVDQELVDKLAALLKEYPEIQVAYLFGSRARGTQIAASDVDIAVVFEPETSAWSEVKLREKLASQLGLPVQVINLAYAGPNIVEAVCRDGILIIGDAGLIEKHRTIREEHTEYSQADEAIWLLESVADKVQRIDSALPLLADVEPEAVLAEDMKAVRDFLGVFMLIIEPLETLVRRVSRYAHLVLEYEKPDTTLRAQTKLTAQVLVSRMQHWKRLVIWHACVVGWPMRIGIWTQKS